MRGRAPRLRPSCSYIFRRPWAAPPPWSESLRLSKTVGALVPEAPLSDSSRGRAGGHVVLKGTSPLPVLSLKQSLAFPSSQGMAGVFKVNDLQTCQNRPPGRATPLHHAPLSPAPGAQSFAKNFLIRLRCPQGAPDATSAGWPPGTSERVSPGFLGMYWRPGIIKTRLSCDKAGNISLCQP